jgi:hypothetical protein
VAPFKMLNFGDSLSYKTSLDGDQLASTKTTLKGTPAP